MMMHTPPFEKGSRLESTIHAATLKILQDIGVKVMNDDAVELFHGAGAIVKNADGHSVVKIPSAMVEECLAEAPRRINFNGRASGGKNCAPAGQVTFSTFGGCIKVIDPFTGERRFSCKKDLENIIRISDYLDEIGIANRVVNATDIPIKAQSVHNMDAILKNTGKHFIIGADSPDSLKAMFELAAVSVGGMENLIKTPVFSVSVCPVSPLVIPQNRLLKYNENIKILRGL